MSDLTTHLTRSLAAQGAPRRLTHVHHRSRLLVVTPRAAGRRRSPLQEAVKAGADRVLASLLLLVLAVPMLLVALAVRLDSAGPVIFRQTRVGRRGRHFAIYKFRSMTVDAEVRLDGLRTLNEADGPMFKMREDPRVTRVGRFIRRTSLDELPQLWNVVRGEMSLVGPRPALPDEAEKYAEHVRRRLVVKPGLTGLWQVNGRSDLSWEESVRLDLRYVENWSFALDLQILWKTISVMMRGSGAY